MKLQFDENTYIAFTLLSYIPMPMDKEMLASLMDNAQPCSGNAAKTALNNLTSEGLVDEFVENDRLYVRQNLSRMPCEQFSDMVENAVDAGIIPSITALRSALYVSHIRSSDLEYLLTVAEFVQFIASGFNVDFKSSRIEKVLQKGMTLRLMRGVAFHAASVLIDEPVFSFNGTDDPFFKFMPFWINARFVSGLSISRSLDAIGAVLRDSRDFSNTRLVMAYMAACFWTADKSSLNSLDLESSRRKSEKFQLVTALYSGVQSALAGDFTSAETWFKKVVKLRGARRTRYYNYVEDDGSIDRFPERLMMATCAAVANPEKPFTKAQAKVIAPLNRDILGWNTDLEPDIRYEVFIECTSECLSTAWNLVVFGNGALLNSRWRKDVSPILYIMNAWAYRMVKHDRKKFAPKVVSCLDNAKFMWKQGYANVAALYLSLLSNAFDVAKEAEFVDAVRAVTVPFLPEIGENDEWLALLGALRKSVTSAEKTVKRTEEEKSKKIVWQIDLDNSERSGVVLFSSVYMAIRPANGSEDGSDDEIIDYRWHGDQKRVRLLLSGKNLVLMEKLRNSTLYETTSKVDVLTMMIGMDNIYTGWRRYDNKARCYRLVDLCKVAVVARNCEMKSTILKDGGLELSVPLYNLDRKADAVPVWEGEDTIAVMNISLQARKVLDVFAEYGVGGKIVIPPHGMKDAAPLVQAMTNILPLAAPTEREKKHLRKVEANIAIVMRLSFDGSSLVMQAGCKPVAAMPDLVVSPGEGQGEKVVADATGGYLLVRNLDAEKSLLNEMATSLESLDTWYDGKFTWRIDDKASALDGLCAVKSLVDQRKVAFSMEWREDRKIVVTNAPQSGVKMKSSRTAEEWFRVDGDWKLDDGRIISIANILEASRNRFGDYVQLSDGDFIRLTTKMSKQLAALSAASRRKGDGVEISRAAIPMLDNALDGSDGSLSLPDAMAKTAEEIRSAFARRPQVPKGLKAELRPYQTDGFRWLSRLAGCAFGSCLADDMGLGKTLQIIAVLLDRAKDGASLVIAPSSVCGNWRSEIHRFAPSLRPRMAYDEDTTLASCGPMDVVIASYNYALFHEREFIEIQWNGLVLDEAQAIKNDASKRARFVKRLPSKFRIAATGTPVENRLGELWSIFDFLNPGLLGAATSFVSRFTNDGKATPELKRLVKPLILRRLKNEVLEDLPEKTETTIEVELGSAEREAYEACRIHALSQLENASAQDGEGPNRISILAQLTRLRRFCCHPSLVLPDEHLPSAKMEALVDLLSNLKESSHRALVFSQFTDYLAIVRKVIDAHGWSHLYLDGSTPAKERERLVNGFQSGEGDFFVISLKAGGTGLNLTAADYVILLDPWWNPAVENQAADRAHRIGQKNPVTVYRLIASHTVEERVLELHNEKKEIAEDVLDSTGSTSLSPAQLMRLFQS